jgi:hypothetical protein
MPDSPPNADFWKRKLAAFLHDPPHKPFRIAGHEDARKSFCLEVALDEADLKTCFERPSDHQAAAADRMVFPDPKKSGVRTDWLADSECAFLHPLAGTKLTPDKLPASVANAEEISQSRRLLPISAHAAWNSGQQSCCT